MRQDPNEGVVSKQAMKAANRRLGILVGVLGFISGVLGATGAWACVPQPLISLQPLASGPPGSQVTVEALAVDGTVEIRWNSVDGPRLATANGPAFSVQVTIPEAPAGLYAMVVFERMPDGSVGSSGRAAFQVTADPIESGGKAPASTIQPDASLGGSSSSAPPPAALVVTGAGLVIVGGFGGALITRRRRR